MEIMTSFKLRYENMSTMFFHSLITVILLGVVFFLNLFILLSMIILLFYPFIFSDLSTFALLYEVHFRFIPISL